MDSSIDRVVPLDELDDFRVAEGDPDVRGWDVLSSDGRKVGEVENLLIDTDAMKVRYLDVDIEDDLLADGTDRHILIPIGFARLDEDSDRIFVDGLNSASIQQLPEYRRGGLTRDFETSLHGHFERDFSTPPTMPASHTRTDFYGRELPQDAGFVARDPDLDRLSGSDRTEVDLGRVELERQGESGIREDGRDRF